MRNLPALRQPLVPSLVSDRQRPAPHRREHAGATALRLTLSLLVVVTFGAIAPLAHVMPPDQTWIGGFYDNADYDEVILAVMGVDGAPDSGRSVLFPWATITQLRSSTRPVSVASDPRLTLADRAPPLR